MLFRIDAAGEIGRGGAADRLAQLLGLEPFGGDRVQVHDAVDALVRLLHGHPVDERTQIIAEVQAARGLHAGEDARFELDHCSVS